MNVNVCDRIDAVASITTDNTDQFLPELFWISFSVQLSLMESATLKRMNVFFHSCLFHFPPSSLFSKSSQSTCSMLEMTSFTLIS